MADQNALMQGNNFGPLTPEQEEMLRRQAVSTEMPALLELLLSGGLMGGVGRAVGRGMGHAGSFIAGQSGPGAANIAGRIGGGLGAMSGIGGAYDAAQTRAQANTMMDAEGQPGGFYGNALMRR